MSKTMTTAEKLAREWNHGFAVEEIGPDEIEEIKQSAFIAGFQAGVESAQLELRRANVYKNAIEQIEKMLAQWAVVPVTNHKIMRVINDVKKSEVV